MPDSLAILLPLPLAGSYDYLVEGLALAAGDFVVVPLGRRETIGVVWGPGTGEVPGHKLKPVIARLDVPPLPEVTRRFVDRVAAYTLAPPGAVLRMSMSVSAALEPPRTLAAWRLAEPPAASQPRETPARLRVRAVLQQGPAMNPSGRRKMDGGGRLTASRRPAAAIALITPVPTPASRARSAVPRAGPCCSTARTRRRAGVSRG